MKKEVILAGLILGILSLVPLSLAGVGIKWEKESIVLEEGGKACVSYGVYNPWPTESYVVIELSEELKEVLIFQETETKLIPANTPSGSAIPIEFCFEVPQVYEKDCFLGTLCKQECSEEQKIFSGEVMVKSVANPSEIDNSGGSATQMVVSAPLRIKVICNSSGRDLTALYILIAVVSLIIIIFLVRKNYNKSPTSITQSMPKRKIKRKIVRKKKLKRNK
ncbi:MAG: hypothetical protein WC494_00685 [Candidatus Pacearchaeota archaeon]